MLYLHVAFSFVVTVSVAVVVAGRVPFGEVFKIIGGVVSGGGTTDATENEIG